MRKLTSALLGLALVLSFASPALAWGNDGHKTVGEVAMLRLKADHKAAILARIKQVLDGKSLGDVATWADQVKGKKFNARHPSADPDTDEFLKESKNKGNRRWHFVDLPLDCVGYDQCKKFNEEFDIVQMIRVCILTLQGHASSQHPLSERNALRMLVHLMGDLHQPLHVGVRFMKADEDEGTFNVLTAPATIGSAASVARDCSNPNDICSDVGGNLLLLNGSDSSSLHAYWDESLVETAMEREHQSEPAGLAAVLFNKFQPQPAWAATGQLTDWPVQWANDTLQLSKASAYEGVTVTGVRRADPFGQGSNDTLAFDISKPRNYRTTNVPVVETQLAKGGYRLAKLLEVIYKNL